MNCDQVRRLLSDRLDQPLAPDQAAAVRAHLAGCRECRAFERALTAGVIGLESLPRSLPSPRVRANVQQYVDQNSTTGPDGFRGDWLRQVGAFAGAATVLAAVAVLLIVLLNGRTAGPPQAGSGPPAGSPTLTTALTGSAVTLSATPAPRPTAMVDRRGTPPVVSPAPTATPQPVVVTAAEARSTVAAYFDAINRHDYAGAYGLLGADLRGGQSLDDFAAGFSTTAHDALTVVGAAPEDGDVAVSMRLVAAQTDGSVRSFSGRYLVGVEGESVRIVGADVHEDTPAPAATPAATPSALPSCAPDQVTMGLSAQGATGNIVLAVVFHDGGAPCRLTGPLAVTVAGASGNALAIQGNGAAVPLNLVLGGADASITFAWSNWCGTERQFVVTTTLGSLSSRLDQSAAPRCDAPDAPSQLHEVTQATWAGTVVANTPGTGAISLRFPDGTTRRVVIGPKTVVTDAHGNAVAPAGIKVGSHLSAVGDVSADATAMEAAVVVVQG